MVKEIQFIGDKEAEKTTTTNTVVRVTTGGYARDLVGLAKLDQVDEEAMTFFRDDQSLARPGVVVELHFPGLRVNRNQVERYALDRGLRHANAAEFMAVGVEMPDLMLKKPLTTVAAEASWLRRIPGEAFAKIVSVPALMRAIKTVNVRRLTSANANGEFVNFLFAMVKA